MHWANIFLNTLGFFLLLPLWISNMKGNFVQRYENTACFHLLYIHKPQEKNTQKRLKAALWNFHTLTHFQNRLFLSVDYCTKEYFFSWKWTMWLFLSFLLWSGQICSSRIGARMFGIQQKSGLVQDQVWTRYGLGYDGWSTRIDYNGLQFSCTWFV